MVKSVAIVNVDSQRRIYIPKGLPFKAEKAIIVPQGSSYLLIPVPPKIIEVDVRLPIGELRKKAEEKAMKEARERALRTERI